MSDNPVIEVRTLQDLLALPGPRFVEALYRILLGREPDSTGREYYRRRLMLGVPKAQIVKEFIESPEGRTRAREIEPLLAGLTTRPSLLGRIRQRIYRWMRVPGSSPAAEARLNSIEARLDETADAVAALSGGLSRLGKMIELHEGESRRHVRKVEDHAQIVASVITRLDSEIDGMRTALRAQRPAGRAGRIGATPLEDSAIQARLERLP
jgi:hypothetical protein